MSNFEIVNDNELYLLMFLIVGSSISLTVYCICCTNDKNRLHGEDISLFT